MLDMLNYWFDNDLNGSIDSGSTRWYCMNIIYILVCTWLHLVVHLPSVLFYFCILFTYLHSAKLTKHVCILFLFSCMYWRDLPLFFLVFHVLGGQHCINMQDAILYFSCYIWMVCMYEWQRECRWKTIDHLLGYVSLAVWYLCSHYFPCISFTMLSIANNLKQNVQWIVSVLSEWSNFYI
jgi:hypothetical protein